jgi:hypothetical protein
MIHEPHSPPRNPKTKLIEADLAVIGGGLAGCCAAITAARQGLRVALVHDRPVLGGNASSEVRLWILGATSHMGSNNRWAREGGAVDELMIENLFRNPEGNAVIFDTVLLDMVLAEQNIQLLLNTAALGVTMGTGIESVDCVCSQNSTRYTIRAPLFADCSGDGIVGFLSGASFRMGAESREEFGEGFAPDEGFGELLGHSIYFYSRDTGRPIRFVPPSYALQDIEREIPRYRDFNTREYGCRLWWIEYGGRLDTVHDTEAIKWELWRVALGAWNYIKNSGKFPEAENLTLEWLGHVPGKRESRRFVGDYTITQNDIIGQHEHPDAVAYGGWALDLHPADGVFSPRVPYTHEHARGIYQIPYRCLYSRDVGNLFLGGRLLSASHVAFGSTRVMATLAHCGQAIGTAAAVCHRKGVSPRACSSGEPLAALQLELMRSGQHIPGFHLHDPLDLVQHSAISASSEYVLDGLPPDGDWHDLSKKCWAQMLPASPGPFPKLTFWIEAAGSCEMDIELRTSERPDNFTPEVVLAKQRIRLEAGHVQEVEVDFHATIAQGRYVFVCLMGPIPARVRTSSRRLTGILSVQYPAVDATTAVAIHRRQEDRPELGIIGLERWFPERRPGGENLAFRATPPFKPFAAENVANGIQRPTCQPNAWVASMNDPSPTLTLRWNSPQRIQRLELFFDTDCEHPMETVLLGHPEREIPFCVKHYRIQDAAGIILCERTDNHQTRNTILLPEPVLTASLQVGILAMCGDAPPAIFEVRAYA